MRRRTRTSLSGSNTATLGFLDVNFGVLGIFLIIFAVRILMNQADSGLRADVLAIVSSGESASSGRISLYHDDAHYLFESALGNPYSASNALGSQLLEKLHELSANRQSALQVNFIVLPDGFDAQKAVSASLSDSALSQSDTFLPIDWTIQPALTPEDAESIIADWSGETQGQS